MTESGRWVRVNRGPTGKNVYYRDPATGRELTRRRYEQEILNRPSYERRPSRVDVARAPLPAFSEKLNRRPGHARYDPTGALVQRYETSGLRTRTYLAGDLEAVRSILNTRRGRGRNVTARVIRIDPRTGDEKSTANFDASGKGWADKLINDAERGVESLRIKYGRRIMPGAEDEPEDEPEYEYLVIFTKPL